MVTGIRINKYLSEQGICSRREADRLLEEGRIRINGRKATVGEQVLEGDRVQLDDEYIGGGRETKQEPVILAFNKPRGIVCTTVSQDASVNIIDYIGYKTRIFPVGRLDKDSEGLILLTNMGDIVNALNRARNHHEKEYIVTCTRKITEDALDRMRKGVEIAVPARAQDKGFVYDGRKYKNVRTAGCEIYRIDDRSFGIILTQGLNRQIRRMCEAVGYKVMKLRRIRVMNIRLGALPVGRYRELSKAEINELREMLKI